MPRSPKPPRPKPPQPKPKVRAEELFEKVLRANEEVADEGKPLKPEQTHRIENGKPVRHKFSLY